jgi:hypothetical protein
MDLPCLFQEVVMETSGNRHESTRSARHTHIDRRGDRHFRRRGCLAPNTGVTAGLGVKTMTISVQRLVMTSALLLVGVAASARAQGIETVTNVPFAFTAGDTNLPRDTYRISPMKNGVFMIRGERQSVMLMSQTDRRNDREPAPSLTFYRYGDQYFLREVQLGDGRILHLSQTRAETKAAEYVAAQAAAKSKVAIASSLPK